MCFKFDISDMSSANSVSEYFLFILKSTYGLINVKNFVPCRFHSLHSFIWIIQISSCFIYSCMPWDKMDRSVLLSNCDGNNIKKDSISFSLSDRCWISMKTFSDILDILIRWADLYEWDLKLRVEYKNLVQCGIVKVIEFFGGFLWFEVKFYK